MSYTAYSPETKSAKRYTHRAEHLLAGICTAVSVASGYAGYLFTSKFVESVLEKQPSGYNAAVGSLSALFDAAALILGAKATMLIVSPTIPTEVPPLPRDLATALKDQNATEPSLFSTQNSKEAPIGWQNVPPLLSGIEVRDSVWQQSSGPSPILQISDL